MVTATLLFVVYTYPLIQNYSSHQGARSFQPNLAKNQYQGKAALNILRKCKSLNVKLSS